MKRNFWRGMLLVLGLVGGIQGASAQYILTSATGTFSPSFRDGTNLDLGNTTYFGWGATTFDGGTNNELMENPAPNLGVGGLDGALNQDGTVDILAGSNNIYTTGTTPETLSLTVATNGTVGASGFTTIIIQGLTSGGGGPAGNLIVNYPVFATVNGVTPEFSIAVNANSVGQWWVKYELTGNQAIYDIDFTVVGNGDPTKPLTIAKLEVDTQYSTTGFATDTAAVPEPSTYALMFLGLGLVLFVHYRRREMKKVTA